MVNIKEVLVRWRTERLKKDPLIHNVAKEIERLVQDLIAFVKQNGLTVEELNEELDGDIKGWVETAYSRLYGTSGGFR